MGKHALRKDMTCLNCRHVVEKRFCPNCGQENKHTKESFHFLFTHFIEDLTHYDGSFWKTIKYLLFNPAKLTKEYLSGKRQTYVPPVKLYIFISFVTFLLLSTLPVFQTGDHSIVKVKESNKSEIGRNKRFSEVFDLDGYKNVATFDSIQKALPEAKKTTGLEYWTIRKMLTIDENNTMGEFKTKFTHSVFQNLPKVFFIYLPLFAFILWLFHDKKRWYYFDHGIFTLHYFSMLLLSFTLFMLLSWVVSWFGTTTVGEIILFLATSTMFFWWIFYFFRSHSRLYQNRKWVSRTKAGFIFVINFFFMAFFLLFLVIYSALNVN